MYKINQKYDIDILNYCKLNGIEDVELFVNQCFKQGLDVKKYGFLGGSDEKPEEIEVIREIRVEVPVEVIREIIVEKEIVVEKEVIKEIIVDRIIEIPVEKIVEKEVIKEVLVDKIIEKVVEVPIDRIIEKEVIKEVPVEKIVTKIEYISDKTSENELLLKIQQLESEMSKKDENLDEFRRDLDEVLDKPPVEIIKEVEVVKEVEKIVTNIEYIRDETEINNLLGMIGELTKELENEKNNVKTIEIVKEVQVIVEKDVETSNDKSKMLENTLQNLRKELSLKNDRIKDLEEINKQLELIKVTQGAIFLKGSNLTQNL